MNILFLTLVKLSGINNTMVYTDLLHTFENKGHDVYAVCPLERKDRKDSFVEISGRIHLLHTLISGNYFNVNVVEKGMTMLFLEKGYIQGICEQFQGIKFDLILYTTPPITFNRVVKYIKKRDGAVTYLMLKDIFPQNAIDMGMLSKFGLKGLLYKYFRRKEKELYNVSDYIGCMSQANIEYVKTHNPEIDFNKIEISPNSIIIRDMSITEEKKNQIREKYNIPKDKLVFVYGGNLGKPQGISFLIDCLRLCKKESVYFIIIGDGAEYYKLNNYIEKEKQENVRLMQKISKDAYDILVSSCDVGLIFLDHRFTIPNFPSRLLSYLQSKIPVLACTDTSSDIGKVIEEGKFGWWCESNNVNGFKNCVDKALVSDLNQLGKNAYSYLEKHYNVEDSVKRILDHVSKRRIDIIGG